jgi:hypothetical protein
MLAACFGNGNRPEVFTDATTGISFELPESWRNRYAVQALDGALDPTANRAKRVLYFKYLGRDQSIPSQILVALYLYHRADWDTVSAEPGPPQGDLVAEKDTLAVIAGLPQSNPFPGGSPDSASFDSLTVTVEELRRAVSIK